MFAIFKQAASRYVNFLEVKSLKKWKIRELETVKFAVKTTSDLNADVWVLVPHELTNAYNKILAKSLKLVDLVGENNIFNGIQTSANEIYIFTPLKEDANNYYFNKKNVNYKIEKAITKPYFQTSSGEDNLNTYRTFKPNARLIYPYEKAGKGVKLLSLRKIGQKYPLAFDYFQKHKEVLSNPKRDIKPVPTTKNEWHRFGRQQGLNILGRKEKIILGVLSSGDKYAIDKFGTLFTSGGTAGYCAITLPPDIKYSIYYIQAILNSKYVEWFVILTGEIFRGSYFARGTKVLNNLPIRKIDFTNATDIAFHDSIVELQKELIKTQDQIDANILNNRKLATLVRQFENDKLSLERQLAELFDLGEDDSKIPLIKQLYEAN